MVQGRNARVRGRAGSLSLKRWALSLLGAGAALALVPATASGQTWSNYDQYTSFYQIPYANSTSVPTGALKVNVLINGLTVPIQMDTGSRGFWISSEWAGSLADTPGVPGYIFYWSSGNAHIGIWHEITVTFPDSVASDGSGRLATATIPVLVTSALTCLAGSWPNSCGQPGSTAITTVTGFMGIGFDRTGHGTSYGSATVDPTGAAPTTNLQILNPFLNLSEMTTGSMRSGYILSQSGVVLGLTSINTASGYGGSTSVYAYAQLLPTGTQSTPGTPTDWQVMAGSVVIGGTTYQSAQAVVDIGITNMLLTTTAATLPGQVTKDGQIYLSAATGTMVVNLLGLPGLVSYSFNLPVVTPTGANATVVPENVAVSPPQSVAWTGGTEDTLVNTGIYALNAFNYLYDATGGFIGLQLNGSAASAGATFQPVISAIGQLSLANNFYTDLPVYLRGDSIISTGSSAVFNGKMWGPGGLTITGGGNVTLAGVNTYEGGTVVQSGMLILTGALAGSVSVASGASFDNRGNYVGMLNTAGQVTNSGNMVGQVTVQGSGGLSNSGIIVGRVSNAGLFQNNGIVTDAVDTSGVLSGNGTVGSLRVASGGVVSPGNSIGTVRVAGDATFAPGTVLVAELGAPGTSDQLIVGGTLTAGGAVLVPVPGATFSAQLGATYGVVSAGSTASAFSVASPFFGSFGTTYPFLAPSLAGNGVLTLGRSGVSYGAYGSTANAMAAGRAADALSSTSPLNQSLAAMPGVQAPGTLLTLTGEIYASAQSTLQEHAAYVRDAVSGRLQQAEGAPGAAKALRLDREGTMLWGQAYGGWGSTQSDGNASGVTRSIGGFLMGLDGMIADWRMGVAAGFSQSNFSTDSVPGSGSSDTYDLALYAGRSFGASPAGAWTVRLGAAYSWHDLSVSRTVSLAGQMSPYSTGYAARTAQAFGEIGYDFTLGGPGGTTHLEPFAGLAYSGLDTNGFAEPYGPAALRAQSASFDSFSSTLGLRARAPVMVGRLPVTLSGLLGWQHGFGDLVPTTTFAFASGSTPFTVAGAPLAADALVVGLGVGTRLSETVDLAVRYRGQIASGVTETALQANLSVRF